MAYDIIIGRTESDKKKFGDKGTVLIGKSYVKMGQFTSLSNNLLLDVARSHVLLVSGKRGCLTGDTFVFTDKGYKEIKDFDEDKDSIYSFNTKKQTFELEKAKLLKYAVKEELFEIELSDGQKLSSTKEHPFLVKSKEKYSWKKASELNEEDKFVSMLELPKHKPKNKISVEIARILGFVLADGTMFEQKGIFKDGRGYLYNGRKARLRIFNAQEEVLLCAKKDLENSFNIDTKRYRREIYNSDVIESKQQKVVDKLAKLGVPIGKKSSIIRVPVDIFTSSNKVKSQFLKALFSCDGTVSKDGQTVEYYSNSCLFLKDLQLLLSHFGIHGKVREKKVTCNNKRFLSYALSIWDYESIKKYEKHISFFSEEKRRRLKKRRFWRMSRRKSTEYLSQELFFESIKKISRKFQETKVYDLTVSKNHSFIANGIISHNSGKSYSLGVIAEGIANLEDDVKKNISVLMFDTMGIFWSMKYPNVADQDLLEKSGFHPKGLDINVYAPKGKFKSMKDKKIPVDYAFTIKTSELTAEDWLSVFSLDILNPIGILIERIIDSLENKNYSIGDILNEIKKDKRSDKDVKDAAENRFLAAQSWGLFETEGTKIKDILEGGKVSVLDISSYDDWNLRSLVVSLICKKLFRERMLHRKAEEINDIESGQHYFDFEEKKRGMPLVWLFVDECVSADTEIITNTNHTKISDIVKKFKKGEEVYVFSYDNKSKKYLHKKVTNVYKIPNRSLVKITTECGRIIKCTPDHLLFSKEGYISAISTKDVAIPFIQHYSEDKNCIKARLLGYLWGDGWLSKNKTVGFSGKGNNDDLLKIKEDLLKLGLESSEIKTRKTRSEIKSIGGRVSKGNGLTSHIYSSRKVFEYFRDLGAPIGQKILIKTEIPKWIKDSNNKVKSEFLAGFMGADGQRISTAKNAKGDYNAIRLTFNKDEKLEKDAFRFSEEIRNLFENIGIKISNISKRNGEGNVRKDGISTLKIQITLAKNNNNTIRFLEKIGYRYCNDKEKQGLLWLEYLKARLYEKQKRENLKLKALNLQNRRNIGKTKISKILNIKEYEARSYIYENYRPGVPKKFDSFDEWMNKRLSESFIFEKIGNIEKMGNEDVYDITVEDTHNFIANNIISHNCHEFLPKKGKTPATDALVQLLREGRQPGISLVLATQQPGQIHKDVMTQSDIVLSHRLTAKFDIEALKSIMQTYLNLDILSYLNNLPRLKGSAIILDDNSERIYPMRTRPKMSWHGGSAPSSVKINKKELLDLKLE